MAKGRVVAIVAAAIAVALVAVAVGVFVGAEANKTEPTGKTITIAIPRGAQAEIDKGNKDLIPERIVGYEGDKLIIVNRDKTAQHVGPFYVEGGQKLDYSLSKAGVFAGECNLTPSGRFALIVKKARPQSS